MSAPPQYTLYISSLSPYSIKTAAMVRYMELPCRVVLQTIVNRYTVLRRLTGKTMVPMLRRGSWAINDSTRIAHYLIEERGGAKLLPRDEALEPWCWLLEDFADEWVSKWFIYNRWQHEADARVTKRRVGAEMAGGLPLLGDLLGEVSARGIVPGVRRAGIVEENERALMQSRDRLLTQMNALLSREPAYLFENHPTVADFALYGPLEQYRGDPTGAQVMTAYPHVEAYLDRINGCWAGAWPQPIVAMSRPLEELEALIAEMLGTYWPLLVRNAQGWSRARGKAVEAVMLDGSRYRLKPARYLVGRLKVVVALLEQALEREDAPMWTDHPELRASLRETIDGLTSDLG